LIAFLFTPEKYLDISLAMSSLNNKKDIYQPPLRKDNSNQRSYVSQIGANPIEYNN
jgi:hypothetical protein